MLPAELRKEVSDLVTGGDLRAKRDLLVAVLRAVEGARSQIGTIDAIWTMPGHLSQSGALTGSVLELVRSARRSVVASTFNLQQSSGMWVELREAAGRDGMSVSVYIDTAAAEGGYGPNAETIAAHLAPAKVFRTATFGGKQVRNHAKFVVVDHRFVVVTSANMSWSAENVNVELGVRVDDAGFAERIERQMRDAQGEIYVSV